MGHPDFPLSAQIADTIKTHGAMWAAWHYMTNPKGPRLSALEWRILSRSR